MTDHPTGLRLRAVVVGLLLCAGLSAGIPYGEFVIQGTRLGLSSSTPAAFFLLFLMILLVHPALAALRPSWGFSRDELLLITVMVIVANAIPSRGFTGIALATISGVPYYATPENRWEEVLIPYVPDWIRPEAGQAIKDFYEGLPAGAAIPWQTWIAPVAWWLLLMAALYVVLICAMTLMRRETYLRLPYFEHMHRFLAALVQREGLEVVAVPVHHRPRQHGRAKYGVQNRLWVGIVDLFGVLWLQRRMSRPSATIET